MANTWSCHVYLDLEADSDWKFSGEVAGAGEWVFRCHIKSEKSLLVFFPCMPHQMFYSFMTNVLRAVVVFSPGVEGIDSISFFFFFFFSKSHNIPWFREIINPASSRLDNACSISGGKKQRSKYLLQNVFLMSWKLVNFLHLTSRFSATSASYLEAKGKQAPTARSLSLGNPGEIMWPQCCGIEYW